jgi:hypothetical protein
VLVLFLATAIACISSAARMGVQGEKIYLNALLAGSLGFITFGWDAGVLGGILLTPEFQTAMGVRRHVVKPI